MIRLRFTLRQVLVNPFKVRIGLVSILRESKYFRNEVLCMESLHHFQHHFAFCMAAGNIQVNDIVGRINVTSLKKTLMKAQYSKQNVNKLT